MFQCHLDALFLNSIGILILFFSYSQQHPLTFKVRFLPMNLLFGPLINKNNVLRCTKNKCLCVVSVEIMTNYFIPNSVIEKCSGTEILRGLNYTH